MTHAVIFSWYPLHVYRNRIKKLNRGSTEKQYQKYRLKLKVNKYNFNERFIGFL